MHILSHKYSFFKLRQSEIQCKTVDLEQDYLLSPNLIDSKISTSDTCLLIGLNPRYEGSKLNLTLRSRYLKGNFKIIQIGSLSNLTISTRNLSNNIKSLKSVVEGNNLFCQEIINSVNPILISNSEIFKREDAQSTTNLLKFLVKYIRLHTHAKTSKQINVLSSTLNESGLNNFNLLNIVKNLDFKDSAGIYFLNNSFATSNIKKLLNLKLLNFFYNCKDLNRLLITQNNTVETKDIMSFKKSFGISKHIHLPNSVFFEDAGTYMNLQGHFNNLTKIITPLNQTKSD